MKDEEDLIMNFKREIFIKCTPEEVFAFLRDKDLFPQEEDSPVLILERTTEGEVGVGTRYREVVRMFPMVEGEILSEIVAYEPPLVLEETFEGTGMKGRLRYEFQAKEGGTLLIQEERIEFLGWLGFIEPLIRGMFLKRIEWRLKTPLIRKTSFSTLPTRRGGGLTIRASFPSPL